MVDLAEIQAPYYMVAATGVLIAAIYYVITNLPRNSVPVNPRGCASTNIGCWKTK